MEVSEKGFKILHQLLYGDGAAVKLVDIGARNGVMHLAHLAPFIDAYGFEPNPVEFDKLVEGNTDASKAGFVSPPYRSLQYYPYALSNSSGSKDFFPVEDNGSGMAGMLEFDWNRVQEIKSHGGNFQFKESMEGFQESAVFSRDKSIQVETIRLDEFTQKHDVQFIDYLKIDVEGYEYEVLQGATGILPNTSVIYVEVSFVPLRKEQKLFSDIDIFLREYGFDLLHFEVGQGQVGYKTFPGPQYHIPLNYFDSHAQPLLCDAVYLNRKIQDRQRNLVQGAVLCEMMYLDEGLHILQNLAKIDIEKYEILLKEGWSAALGEKLRFRGYELIDGFVGAISRVKRMVK